MSANFQSILALAVVATTVGVFVWKAATKKKTGCAGGCGCHAQLKVKH
jgi:hypothetical protein